MGVISGGCLSQANPDVIAIPEPVPSTALWEHSAGQGLQIAGFGLF